MEELRSTEALDREILEDARKKADRALRDADKAARAAEAEWEAKLEADLAALEARHAERVAARKAETDARLPLDRRRLRAERADRLLRTAMERVLGSFPRGRLLDLLVRELKERAPELPEGALKVFPAGLDAEEAKSVLARAFSPAERPVDLSRAQGGQGALPALSVEGARTTVRVGAAASGEELLREKRAELAAALLGPEALDD